MILPFWKSFLKAPSDVFLRLGFMLSLCILAGIGLLAYHSVREFIDTGKLVENSHALIEQLEDLRTEVDDVESAARGFIMAGQDLYLEPYYTALHNVNHCLGEIRELASETPVQQSLVTKIETLCTEKLDHSRQMVRVRKQAGFDAAANLFLTGSGRATMDRLRDGVNEMENAASSALKERSAAAQAHGRNAIGALLIGTLLSFSMLSLVYYQLHREIRRRRSSEQRTLHLNRLYSVLYEVGQCVVRIRHPETLLREVCRITVEEGLLQMAWVGLVNENRCIVPVAHFGEGQGLNERMGIQLEGGPDKMSPFAHRLSQGQHCLWSDTKSALPWSLEAAVCGLRSMAVVPLIQGDRLRGAFTVGSRERDFFDEEIVALVRSMADEIAFALGSTEQEEKRKRAEEEIRELNRDLERRIEERTSRLAELNKELALRNAELDRASRLKSEFLARMSHELRTPMNAIIGFSDLLAEEGEGALQEEYRRYVSHISRGARHLLQLINDILDISKIEAGRLELSPTEFNAPEALDEVMSMIEPLARIKRICIENRVAKNFLINADRTRFKQILYNLLSNAVKFTPDQGKVWIEVRESPDDLFFTVGDTGIGIAPEEHQGIFDEFHQVAETTRGVKEGTGLGLAITRRLVEMHGGRILVESQPGAGSRFTFNLKSARASMQCETRLP